MQHFRSAVELIDKGDVAGLQAHLKSASRSCSSARGFSRAGITFEIQRCWNSSAENPVRHGTLPANIVEVTKIILDAGPQPIRKEPDAHARLDWKSVIFCNTHVVPAIFLKTEAQIQ